MEIKIIGEKYCNIFRVTDTTFYFCNSIKMSPNSKTKKLLIKYINKKTLIFYPQVYAILPKFFVSFFFDPHTC